MLKGFQRVSFPWGLEHSKYNIHTTGEGVYVSVYFKRKVYLHFTAKDKQEPKGEEQIDVAITLNTMIILTI